MFFDQYITLLVDRMHHFHSLSYGVSFAFFGFTLFANLLFYVLIAISQYLPHKRIEGTF